MIGHFRTLLTWAERLLSRQLSSESLHHDGLIRSYLLYVPRHKVAAARLPLVLVLHGGASRPKDIARASEMHRIAEREGFIVAYPAGMPGGFGFTWNPGGQANHSSADDVGFLRALIGDLCARYPVDPQRVFVAGISIGGSMAYRLACSLSQVFAAVGVVAGAMTYEDCRPAHPVSIIHIHGTADQRVPYEGGRGRFTALHNNWPAISRAIDRWRAINRCEGPGEVIRLMEGLLGHRYTGTADVELWLVDGGRHVWPGGRPRGWHWWRGRFSVPFSASEKIWHFFSAHPRTET